MKLYGQLESAQLENLSSDPANAPTGRVYFNSTSKVLKYYSGTGWTSPATTGASYLPDADDTYDFGSASFQWRDLFLGRNALIGGTLGVTGVATFTAQPILSSLTASQAVFTDGSKGLVSNAITGTGSVVMSASPTLTGTLAAASGTYSGTLQVTGLYTSSTTANAVGILVATSDSATDNTHHKSSGIIALNAKVWTGASTAKGIQQYNSGISGVTSAYAWVLQSSDVSNIIVARGDSGGSVGIGSPPNTAYQLDVFGGIHASGALVVDGAWGPLTTLGDLLYSGASGVATRLAGQTTSTKKFLTQTGNGSASAAPAWAVLVGADLPNPSSSSLGGVQSAAAVSHQWINSISTSGVPALSQPAFTDISGSVASTQMPALTGDVTTSAGAVTTTVAKIAGTTVSGTTGTGNVVFSASPTLTGTIAAANQTLSGTLGVTGVATFTAQPIVSSLSVSQAVFTDGSKGLVSNAITGSGNVVMSASPTLTGTIGAANATFSGTTLHTGVATFTAAPVFSSGTASQAMFLDASKNLVTNAITGTGNVVMSASPTLTGIIAAAASNFSGKVGVGGITTGVSGLSLKQAADGAATGTCSTTQTSATLAGSGTSFTTQLAIGDRVYTSTSTSTTTRTVTAIASDTSATLSGTLAQTAGDTITIQHSFETHFNSSSVIRKLVRDDYMTIFNLGTSLVTPAAMTVSSGGGTPNVGITTNTGGTILGYGLYVNDGTTNRRVKFFLDDTAATWGMCQDYSTSASPFVICMSSTEVFRIDTSGGLVVGNQAALGTSATAGFLYIPTCAGTPTGVPTSYTGKTAMVYDTSNNKLYVYNGAWKSVTLA